LRSLKTFIKSFLEVKTYYNLILRGFTVSLDQGNPYNNFAELILNISQDADYSVKYNLELSITN